MALLFLFRFIVAHVNRAPAGDTGGEQNKRAVRVNCKSLGEFLEVSALRVLAANADGDLHQHALTAPSGPFVRSWVWDFSHTTSTIRGGAGLSRPSRTVVRKLDTVFSNRADR
jgi:hypothetical protein